MSWSAPCSTSSKLTRNVPLVGRQRLDVEVHDLVRRLEVALVGADGEGPAAGESPPTDLANGTSVIVRPLTGMSIRGSGEASATAKVLTFSSLSAAASFSEPISVVRP